MRRRVPVPASSPLLLAVPLLGIARLLPEHGVGLWLRLVAATLVVLLPGRLVSRALGQSGVTGALTWSCAIVAAALAVTFATRSSIDLTLALVLATGAVALPFARRAPASVEPQRTRGRGLLALAGVGLGIGLWSIEGVVRGDAIFHLGRIRKLVELDPLTLHTVDEFRHGGLHPGYAFPLWHGWLALVARVGGVDPTQVVLHESSVLAPLALLLALEAGRAVFRSAWLAFAAVLAQVALIAFAPGGGGAYTSLELPGTVARQLLVPAAIALFFGFVRRPTWLGGATLAAAGMDLAFVHPTYALFLAIPLVGYAVVRTAVAGEDAAANAGALAALGAPVLLVFLWLLPIVRQTRSHDPKLLERARGLKQYATDLVIHSGSSYHLEPGVISRAGAIAVAALVLTPLAALAGRRRWSAFVLGGTVLVLALELSPLLFPHFSDVVSLSQSRRAAGFVPFAFTLVGCAAVLARLSGPLVLPLALAAGIVLQLAFPGDFGTKMSESGPAAPAWIALLAGLPAIVLAAVLVRSRGGGLLERPGPLAALATFVFVLPVTVYGFGHWSAGQTTDAYALTPGLVHYLRTEVPKRSVVYADLETSYRISAYVPVYVANGPPAHVANTRSNDPKARRRTWLRYLRSGSLRIPRFYHAGWLVLRRGEPVQPGATLVYRDGTFRVYRL